MTHSPSANPPRRLLALLGSCLFASLPLLGFAVRGGRDSQLWFVPLGLAWVVSWVLLIWLGTWCLVRRAPSVRQRLAEAFLWLTLLSSASVGWFAIQRAFYELLAG